MRAVSPGWLACGDQLLAECQRRLDGYVDLATAILAGGDPAPVVWASIVRDAVDDRPAAEVGRAAVDVAGVLAAAALELAERRAVAA